MQLHMFCSSNIPVTQLCYKALLCSLRQCFTQLWHQIISRSANISEGTPDMSGFGYSYFCSCQTVFSLVPRCRQNLYSRRSSGFVTSLSLQDFLSVIGALSKPLREDLGANSWSAYVRVHTSDVCLQGPSALTTRLLVTLV